MSSLSPTPYTVLPPPEAPLKDLFLKPHNQSFYLIPIPNLTRPALLPVLLNHTPQKKSFSSSPVPSPRHPPALPGVVNEVRRVGSFLPQNGSQLLRHQSEPDTASPGVGGGRRPIQFACLMVFFLPKETFLSGSQDFGLHVPVS